ncbi:7SK snRNA methylphosphate capping enzyme [Trichomycterus rosablanca]|uniref:7SK snRNA methylphosphate capping enzyme n=1 Tax=Trichomycterus rosablanca TaxID=2290929 RepID=UPI002F35FACA
MMEKEAGDGPAAVLSYNPAGRVRTPSPTSMVPINIRAPFVVLAEVPDDPAMGGEERDVTPDITENIQTKASKPLLPKNGLQGDAGPQRLGKRRYSMNVGFKHPGGLSKRRRRANSECDPVLPSNFLLGGNIFDPLNLNSLLDEEVNRALNAETPESSPLPTKNREPVEILIPRDITDPLNLSGKGGDASGGVLVSPIKRRRHRYKQHGGANGVDSEKGKSASEEGSADADKSPQPYELNTSLNCREEVVQPILPRRRSAPQPESGAGSSALPPAKHRKRRRTVSRADRLSITPTVKHLDTARSQTFRTPLVGAGAGSHHPITSHRPKKCKPKPRRDFHYGTYSRYYGYRTPTLNLDPRLSAFRHEWFRGKRVLDVGCNVGHVTLAIAKNWSPAHILGLDIDAGLVHAARQNLCHFLSELQRQEVRRDAEGERGGSGRAQAFPVSLRLCRGPVFALPLLPPDPGAFPNNVSFMKGNYVPESEDLVASQREEYDVILCLSVTKWVHLNWGDVGVQRLFRRAYRHLTPGGVFILEAQPWSSYSKRKRLTETTHRNYNSIRLRPDRFSSYLTSEVGFSSYELLSSASGSSKGLQRPIYLFHKGPTASSRK